MREPSRPETFFDVSTSSGGPREEPPPMPSTVGPYTLLECLGQGGMGVVYRAHDPRLNRDLAIKLLRPEAGWASDERAQERMMREARAMANLAHPNVVQVFDVGTVGSQVFVAMELVEGRTLTRWLRERPRSTSEIVGLLAQAGRGLQAAHDKGLVHRDFKPDNVLVGDDGRVRVTDFGLVRAVDDGSRSGPDGLGGSSWLDSPIMSPGGAAASGPDHSASWPSSDHEGLGSITRTGVALGTPVYMAAEQHMGQPIDVRTDQFAFCVVLFEALAGYRPFVGKTDLELARVKHAMRMRELPPRKGLRPPVREAILRGLEADPSRRWPGMAPLLAVLDPPRRIPRWLGLGLGGAGVLAAGVWLAASVWLTPGTPHAVDRCEGLGSRIERIWGDARQDAVRAALVATGLPHAEGTWQHVRARVDDHVARWEAAYREACDADPPAPGEVADGRMHCLDGRLAHLESLVATLEEADLDLVDHAVELTSSLHPPAECLDPHVTREDPVPPTPELAEAWARQTDADARIDVLLKAGRGRQAQTLAQEQLRAAEAADWPPLRARALLSLGSALEAAGDIDQAEQVLTEGYSIAHGLEYDALAARFAAQLTWLTGTQQLDEAGAEQWSRHAQTLRERCGCEPWAEIQVQTALGSMYLTLGRPKPAQEAYRRAWALCREHYGDDDPIVARVRANLGAALAMAGDYEGALEHEQAALTIWTDALGELHPERADALSNTAMALARLGRHQEAIELQLESIALLRRTFDPDSIEIATALVNLGAFEGALSRYAEAEAYLRDALSRYEGALGDDDPRIEATRVNLGLAVLRQGRAAEARALAEQSVAAFERVSPEHPSLVHALVLLGTAALQVDDPQRAAEAGERALAMCEADVVLASSMCIRVRFMLARGLAGQPEHRARGLVLARGLAQELQADPEADSGLVREVRDWLDAEDHGPGRPTL